MKQPAAQNLESARRKQRRDEGQECVMHSWAKHGKEAEELRKGIESLIAEHSTDEDTGDYRTAAAVNALCNALTDLLSDVDARDSTAYLERQPKRGVRALLTNRGKKR